MSIMHDKRESAEGKIETLHHTPNCHSSFNEASLHDLRNATIVKNIWITPKISL